MPSAVVRAIPLDVTGGAGPTMARSAMPTVVAVVMTAEVVAMMVAVVATVVAVVATVVPWPTTGAVSEMMLRTAEACTVLLRSVLSGAVMAVRSRRRVHHDRPEQEHGEDEDANAIRPTGRAVRRGACIHGSPSLVLVVSRLSARTRRFLKARSEGRPDGGWQRDQCLVGRQGFSQVSVGIVCERSPSVRPLAQGVRPPVRSNGLWSSPEAYG